MENLLADQTAKISEISILLSIIASVEVNRISRVSILSIKCMSLHTAITRLTLKGIGTKLSLRTSL